MANASRVVFIDSRVPDLSVLLAGLAPDEEAFVLDPTRDGIQQIAAVLAANNLTDLASISIVGHGAAGEIELGSTLIDDANLASESAALGQIGTALAPGGALQLYACSVASGTVGQQFIADLSQFTGGALIAASTQDIGSVPGPNGLTENWSLDASTAPSGTAGAQATAPSAPFTQAAMADFQGDLASPPTTVTWTSLANQPSAVAALVSAADFADGKLYVIDGQLSNATVTSSISVYDPTTNTWRIDGTSDLVARWLVTSVVDESGNIYLIGGDTASGVTGELTRFDPLTDTVVQLGGFGGTFNGVTLGLAGSAAAIANDGDIYVFGGTNQVFGGPPMDVIGSPSDGVEFYDPTANFWTSTTPLPRALLRPAAVADGATIYVIGGLYDDVAQERTLDSNAVYAFDTTTQSWSTVASLPTAVDGATAALVDGKIVVAGGRNGSTETQVYDPLTNTWTIASGSTAFQFDVGQGMTASGSELFAGGNGSLFAGVVDGGVPQTAPGGQLFFRINGGSDAQLGKIDTRDTNGLTAQHTIYTFGGVGQIGIGAVEQSAIAVDPAAGLSFAISPFSTLENIVSDYNLTTGALISTAVVGPNSSNPNLEDTVQALAINPFTDTLYVGFAAPPSGGVSGIETYQYTTSGIVLASAQGIVTSAQNPNITHPIALSVDAANHKLYYVDDSSASSSKTNGVYVLDLNSPSTSTELTGNGSGAGQFPTSGANGDIVGLAVDVADGIVFFETSGAQGSATNALWWVSANSGANQTAHQIALPAGVTLNFAGSASPTGNGAGLTFDPAADQLYLSDAESSTTTADTGALYVLQWNNTTRTVSLVNDYDTALLAGTTIAAASPEDAIGTLSFDDLPTLATSGTTMHAVQRAGKLTLLGSDAITKPDGDHLVGATAQIAVGTFAIAGGDSSAADDHLTIASADRTGSDTSGTINGTAISYSYSSTNETLTLTGYDTLADYQTALSFVQYFVTGADPTAGGLDPTRTIVWQVNDGEIGDPSGPNTTATTLSIDTFVGPSIGLATTATFTENGPAATLSSSIALSDLDRATLVSATVSLAGNGISGGTFSSGPATGDLLSVNAAGTSIVASYNGATETLTLTGADTLAHYTQVLESVEFSSTSQNPTDFGSDTNRIVTWTLNDGAASQGVGTATTALSVTAVNNPPTLSNVATSVQFTQSAGAVVLSSAVSVTDPDNLALANATVAITGGTFVGDGDVLAATTTGTNITASYNGATETLTLTGSDTVADYQKVLETVAFQSTSLNPTDFGQDPTRTVTWTVNDGSAGGFNTTTQTSTIDVTAIDNPPTLANVATGAQFTEGGGAVVLSNAVTVSDPDSLGLIGATVSITTGKFAGDGDVLAANTTGTSITASYNPTTETLTLSGTDTLAHYQSVLDTVSFKSTSLNPTDYGAVTTHQVTWVLEDGAGAGNLSSPVATTPVTMMGMNNPPTLSVASSASFLEKGGAVTLSSLAAATDPDSLTLASATVAITGGTFARDGDVLAATTTGTAITASYDSTTETLTLSGSDTVANYQQVLDSVTFASTSTSVDNVDTSRTLTWTVNDGTTSGTQQSETVSVFGAPSVSVAAGAAYTAGLAPVTLSPSLTLSDPNLIWTTKGSLSVLGVPGTADLVDGTIYATDTGRFITYDPTTQTLSFGQLDSVGRQASTSAVDAQGRVYVIGGGTTSVERLDPQTGTVTSVASLPKALNGMAAATGLNGHIYVFGGSDQTNTPVPDADVYDPTLDTWTPIAPLPSALTGAAAVADGNLIYLIDGSTFEVYDTIHNTWSQRPSPPIGVSNTVAALVDGRIVVAGGFTGFGFTTATQIYDPATNTWTSGLPMPTPTGFANQGLISDGSQMFVLGGINDVEIQGLERVQQLAAVIDSATVAITGGTFAGGGDVLSIGGQTGGTIELGVSAVSLSYDATSETLTLTGADTLADYQRLLDSVTFASTNPNPTESGTDPTRTITWTVTDGFAASAPQTETVTIAAGISIGVNQNAFFRLGEAQVTLSPAVSVSDLDPGPLAWTTEGSSSLASSLDAVVLSGGKIYELGAGSAPAGQIAVYDPATNTWSTINVAGLGSAIDPGTAVDAAGRIYIIGGGSGPTSMVRYDPSTGSVTQLASMPGAFTSVAAATGADGRIYAFGGSNSTTTSTTNAQVYDPTTNTWSSIAPLPLGVSNGSAVADGTLIYVIPGEISSQIGTIEVYDTVNNSWSQIAEPTPVRDPVAGLVDGKLVIAGGASGATQSTLTQIYDPTTGTWSSGPALSTATEFAGRGAISDGTQMFVVGGAGANEDVVQNLSPGPALGSATVQVIGGKFAGDGDILSVGGQTGGTISVGGAGTITLSYNSASETLTLTGSDTLADYQQVLESVTFTSTSANPNEFGAAPTRTITWTVNDGIEASAPKTETVTVAAGITLSVATSATSSEGGGRITLSPAARLSDANPGAFAWTTSGSSTLATSDDAVALSGGKIYAFDGSGIPTGDVAVYDPATSAWSTISVAGLGGASEPGTTVDALGRIYIAAGASGSTSLERYDPSTNTLTQLASMPGSFNAVALATGPDGRIYAFGGSTSDTTAVTNAEVYDPGTNTWSAIAPIPLGVKDGSAVVDGTLIYLVPGQMFSDNGTVQVYDTVNNTWSQIAAEPQAVFFPVAGLVDGKLVVAGGGDANPSTLTQIYDPATGTWSSGPALSTATEFAGRGVISDGHQLFVVGGDNSNGSNIDIVQHLGIDVPMIASATVAITGGTFAGDGDFLSVNGQTRGVVGAANAITVSYNTASETLTLTGTDTISDYQQVLDEITFASTNPNPTNFGADPTRTVTWTVTDDSTAGLGTVSHTSTINIVTVNVPPTLSGMTASVSFTEKAGPVALSSNATVTAPNNLTLFSATVAIVAGQFTGDVLTSDTSGTSITASYNSVSETLVLSGIDTAVDYQSVLDGVKFNSSSLNPTGFGVDPSRTVVWTVTDGTGSNASASATTTIGVIGVNDPPTLAGTANATFTEKGLAVTPSGSALVIDPDNQSLVGATVTLSGGTFTSDGDVLAATPTGNITVSYNSITETLTLSGTDTLAHYQSVLDTVSFNSTSLNPTNFGADPTRIVTWTLNDGSASNAIGTATSTISVAAVNDPPTLSNVATGANFTEASGAVALSNAATVADRDNVNLASATISITTGKFAGDGDVLAAITAGTAITASYNASAEMLVLTGSDTLAHYQSVLDTVSFNSTSINPTDFGAVTSHQVTWVLNDGGVSNNLSDTATTTVAITPVNQPPTLSSVMASEILRVGRSIVVSPSLTISDPDSLTLASATVSVAGGFTGDGDLLVANTAGTGISASYNASSETLSLSGSDTLANYTSVLDSVTFSSGPNLNNGGANPTRTITWTVNDGSALNNTASATTTINVSSARNDFNGDLTSDIVFQDVAAAATGGGRGRGTTDPNAGNAMIALINNGTIASETVLAGPGTGWRVVGSADFNGDGNADLVFQSTTGAPMIWTMNSTSVTSTTTLTNPGSSWTLDATGDFNGDGHPDLLFQNSDGTPMIWTMNGTAVTGSTLLPDPGASWHIAATGDLNGDGKSDIVFQNTDGTPQVWLMNGTTITAATLLTDPGANVKLVGTADFNHDGKADLLFQNTVTGAPQIWTMNGTSVASTTTLASPGAGFTLIGAGNYNGNGQPELLFQNTTTGAPLIFTMSGTSVTGSSTLPSPGGVNWHANTG